MLIKRRRFVSGMDPRLGGPVGGTSIPAAFHAAAGIEESVVSLDPCDEPFVGAFLPKVFACVISMEAGWSAPSSWLWRDPQRLVNWLRQNLAEYYLVMIDELWNASTLGTPLTVAGSQIPCVVFTDGVLDTGFQRTDPTNGAAKQLSSWINKEPFLNSAGYVLFTVKEQRRFVREFFTLYGFDTREVKYGTPHPSVNVSVHAAVCRTPAPDPNKPFFLYLSRIHPTKGGELLFGAFAAAYGGSDRFDLVIAGPSSGVLRNSPIAQAARHGICDGMHWPVMPVGDAKWGAFRESLAFHPAVASGEFPDIGDGGDGLREGGHHHGQGEHVARDRRLKRRPGGAGRRPWLDSAAAALRRRERERAGRHAPPRTGGDTELLLGKRRCREHQRSVMEPALASASLGVRRWPGGWSVWGGAELPALPVRSVLLGACPVGGCWSAVRERAAKARSCAGRCPLAVRDVP